MNLRRFMLAAAALVSLTASATPSFATNVPKMHKAITLSAARLAVKAAGWHVPTRAFCLSDAPEGTPYCVAGWPERFYRTVPEFAGLAVDVPLLMVQYRGKGRECLELSFTYDERATNPKFNVPRLVRSLKLLSAKRTKRECYTR